MRTSRPALVLLGALLALVLAACGIPTDSEPRPLADETTTTATSTVPDAGEGIATVYLVGTSNQLEARDRPLTGEKTPQTVLATLLLPPTEEEAEAGLTSYIPLGATTLGVEQDAGTVTADMSAEWETLTEPTSTTAYAQVVLTLTELPGVERVRFLVEGRESVAPTVNRGNQAVVEADDYAGLDPDGG
jgi:hypothetical protein